MSCVRAFLIGVAALVAIAAGTAVTARPATCAAPPSQVHYTGYCPAARG
jgi:hypothetical protein